MKTCGAMCMHLISGMQPQARKTRTFANIPNAAKGSTPLISTTQTSPISLNENAFREVCMCGECVGTLFDALFSKTAIPVNNAILVITP